MHTGPRAFCILMALAATGTEFASAAEAPSSTTVPVAAGHYRVEAKLVTLTSAATEFRADSHIYIAGFFSDDYVAKLSADPKVSVRYLPSVDSADDFKAHVEGMKQVALPHGNPHVVGIKCDVGQRSGASDDYNFFIKNIDFQGFEDSGTTKPIFHSQAINAAVRLPAQPAAHYVCFSIPVTPKITTYNANGRLMAGIADANERQLLFVKITRG